MKDYYSPCKRCGIIRAGDKPAAELCRDCVRFTVPSLDDDAAPRGHWKRGVVRTWVSHECPDCGGLLLPGTRCDTCLTWAVKNARDAEWARMSWANRHVIWDVLALRNERELMSA